MGDTDSKRAPPPPPLLDYPWRVIDWTTKDKLLNFVRNYKPVGASHVRILVYGPVGAGKSSFINSVGSVIVGRKVNVAAASSSNATTSFTVQFKTHQFKFKDTEQRTVPIVFNDLMGLEADTGRGVHAEDIKLAMEGHVMEAYTFNPTQALTKESKYFNSSPTIDDKVHVLVCMLDGNAPAIHPSVIEKMNEVRLMARNMGIPQVAVLTHIDDICAETEKDLGNVYRSKELKKKLDLFSVTVGIPINNVYAVRNSYEGRYKDVADTLILIVLNDLLGFGDDCIDVKK